MSDGRPDVSVLGRGGVIDVRNIGYLTDAPAAWAKALDEAKTLPELREVAFKWRLIADDAYQIIANMNEKAFRRFKQGLAVERKGKFAGEQYAEKYSAVLMPEIMFQVSVVAHRFMAPWGAAFLRMHDLRLIVVKNGIATYSAKGVTK